MLVVALPRCKTHLIVSNIEYRQHVGEESNSKDVRSEITIHEAHAAQCPSFLVSCALTKQVLGADVERLAT